MKKLFITLITLITASVSYSSDFRQCRSVEVYQLQTIINDTFIDQHASKEEFAHIFCRNHNCYRAYEITTEDTGGSVESGRIERTIRSIKCTNDQQASLWERVSGGHVLNSTFNIMKRRHPSHPQSLPLIKFDFPTRTAETNTEAPFQEASAAGTLD